MSRILTLTLNPALDISTEVAHVRPEEKLRCGTPRFDPGGGGINVSRAIANLGGTSRALVALGGGPGQEVRALLEAQGIEAVDIGPGHATRQSFAVTDRDTNQQYRFLLPGPRWSAGDWAEARARIAAAAEEGDWIVPSGSLPPGVPVDAALRLEDELAPRGVRMVLDTSGKALAEAAQPRAQPFAVLRMDRAEAETIAGPLADLAAIAALARDLVARGAARIAAVASGAEGTVIADGTGAWHCRPPQVPVLSKVGAGDSFVAAMTLALSRGASPAEACADGVAAAAAAVTKPATELCDGRMTRALRQQVRITAL